jgi:hypothetical protein
MILSLKIIPKILAAVRFRNSLVPKNIIQRILHPSSREAYSFTFTWICFYRFPYRPLPQSVQIYLQSFCVAVIHDFPIHHTVVCEKPNIWLQVLPNIIYVCEKQKWAQYAPWR